MAKKIKVNAEFSTTGSGKVVKETDKVTKAVNRVTTSSTSAGRQFSSQAQGLGGLVSAYAGAAATIFAVTQAFDALNRAARAEQTITGVNALANAIGESGPKILKGIQEITKGQLSLVQSAELANLALSSGFSGKQIENLAGIALKASRALGRDLTDSFNRLVRGVAKLEPELLDELGIFVRIEPAAEAYATSIGKVASQLSNFEKRQAFANAVAEEGTDKFKNIDTSTATASQSLETFAATLSDLGTEVGGFIANALQPLVQALTAPGAAIGAFGILTRAVFGTAIREARGSIDKFGEAAQRGGDRVANFLGNTKKAAVANKEFASGLKDVKANNLLNSTADDKRLRQLVALGKAQKLNTSELKEFNKISLQASKINKDKIAQLEALNKLTDKQREDLKTLRKRQKSLNAATKASNDRQKESGRIAQGVGTAFGKAGKGIAAAGRFTLGIIGGLATFITIASIVVTIGAQLAQAFGWTEAISGFVERVVFQFQRLLGITKELKEQAKITEEAGIFKRSAFAEEERVQVAAFKGRNAPGAVRGVTQTSLVQEGKRINELITKGVAEGRQGDSLVDFVANQLFGEENMKTGKIALTQGFIDKVKSEGKRAARFFGTGFAAGVTEFADATGRTITTVINQLVSDAQGRLKFAGATGFGVQFKDTANVEDVGELKRRKEINALLVNSLQTQELEVALQDKLNSGSATAESIEKSVGALQNKKNGLLKEQEALIRRRANADAEEQIHIAELLGANIQNLVQAEKSLEATQDEAAAQLSILQARKEILKTFKSQIAASEKISELFIIEGQTFRLATSTADKRKAQSQFLQQSLDLGKKFLAIQRAGGRLSLKQGQLAALARTSEQAQLGNFMKAVEEAKKLTEQLDKQEKKLKAQKETLELQINLQKIINEETALKTQKDIAEIRLNSAKETLQAEIKLAKVKSDAAKIDRDASSQRVRDIMSEFGDLISPEKQREIELRLAQRDLMALKASIDQQKVNAEKLAQIEKDKVIAQNALLAAQLGGGANAAEGTIQKRAKAEAALAEQRIRSDAESRKAELEAAKLRNRGITAELKGFEKHVDGIANVLAADIVKRQELIDSAANDPKRFIGRAQLAARLDPSLVKQGVDVDKLTPDQAREILVREQLGPATAKTTKELEKLTSKLMINEERFNVLTRQIDANTQAQLRLDRLKRQGATDAEIAKAQAQLAAGQQKLANINTELQAKLGKLNNEYDKQSKSVTNLAKKTADANNTYLQVAKEIATNVGERFANSLRDLNQAMIDGTLTSENFKQGVKDLFVGILQDVQKTVFEKTIVEPAKAFIEESVLGLFGIQPDKKIEDALTNEGGGTAMRVVLAGGAGGARVPMPAAVKQLGIQGAGSGDPVKDIMAANQAMVGIESSDLGGSFQTMDDTLDDVEGALGLTSTTAQDAALSFQGLDSNLQQTNGIFPTFMSAITEAGSAALNFGLDLGKSLLGLFGGGGGGGSGGSGILGSLVKAGVSAFSGGFGGGTAAAAGGFAGSQAGLFTPGLGATPFAIGGLVQKMAAGGMMRDRVPAMLEPGEFVMQRKAVNRIGAQNLSAMNGTGNGMPNISVEVKNEGTPKDAQAQVKPQMDVNKMVVEIVTRDIRNNGPIRKTLRTGAE